MRERKFRGKRADSGAWIYGAYLPHDNIMLGATTEEQWLANKKSIIIMDGMADFGLSIPIHCLEVIPETVGEFTGLQDKTGKNIYEGDIYDIYEAKDANNTFSGLLLYPECEVVFSQGCFCFMIPADGTKPKVPIPIYFENGREWVFKGTKFENTALL